MLRRELNRPYMQAMAMFGLLALAAILVFQAPDSILFTQDAANIPTTTEVTSTVDAAPSCTEAMSDPTDSQCQVYHDRLMAQGFTQLEDNTYVKRQK